MNVLKGGIKVVESVGGNMCHKKWWCVKTTMARGFIGARKCGVILVVGSNTNYLDCMETIV